MMLRVMRGEKTTEMMKGGLLLGVTEKLDEAHARVTWPGTA